jgi:hypothetical protein
LLEIIGGVVLMVAVEVRGGAGYVRRGWTVLAVALIFTLTGIVLGVRILMPVPAAKTSGFGIGDDVRTSFGIVAVEYVRAVDGVSHRALTGANHGVSGLVESGSQQIQVAVALTNRSSAPLTYSVRQFELHVRAAAKTTVLMATAGDLPDGRILPSAGIEGHLDFTLPVDAASLSLHFRDPANSVPVVIDLGTTAASSAPTHAHG